MIAVIFLMAPAQAQDITIAALGDSLTAGYGLAQDQGFVPQLERWLADRGHDVLILNAGVSGDTTAGGLARAAWTLTPDVDAMILALGGNDLLRGLPPETAQANLAGILDVAAEADMPVLLVGLEAPLNFGPEYKVAFDAIYPALADSHGTLLFPDFLQGLRQALANGTSREDLMQPDGIHPTALGVSYMVDAIGPNVVNLIEQVE